VTSFVESVEATDPYSVRFHLQKSTSFFPSLLATSPYFPIDQTCYPAYSLETDSTCGGLGRYIIREWVRDDHLLLEANPDWPGGPSANQKIEIQYFESSEAMRVALEAGSIDLAWNTLKPSDLDALRADDTITVWKGNSSFKRMLIFTQHNAPFSDPKVRQAISYIVDRDELANEAFNGTFSPLYSPIPDVTPGHLGTLPSKDVARGITLLAEAGYSASKPLQFDLWWTDDHYGDSERAFAATLEKQLEATGVVQVSLRNSHWTSYVEKTSECAYPAYLLGWYPDYVDQSTSIDFFALSEATPDLCSNYSNPEMDRLVKAAQSENDPDIRSQHYTEIQQLWAQDLPTLPLLQGVLFAASDKNLEGVKFEVSGALRYDLLNRP
jgi:peptide/nickel transport system substrate-binding protein